MATNDTTGDMRTDTVTGFTRPSDDEKVAQYDAGTHDEVLKETAHAAAERGRAATDRYGLQLHKDT